MLPESQPTDTVSSMRVDPVALNNIKIHTRIGPNLPWASPNAAAILKQEAILILGIGRLKGSQHLGCVTPSCPTSGDWILNWVMMPESSSWRSPLSSVSPPALQPIPLSAIHRKAIPFFPSVPELQQSGSNFCPSSQVGLEKSSFNL